MFQWARSLYLAIEPMEHVIVVQGKETRRSLVLWHPQPAKGCLRSRRSSKRADLGAEVGIVLVMRGNGKIWHLDRIWRPHVGSYCSVLCVAHACACDSAGVGDVQIKCVDERV
jgi:hypothetical protein